MRPVAAYASDPERSKGRQHLPLEDGRDSGESEDCRIRSAFQRDRDRILHSSAFRKLKYKTQVFVYHEGDYFRTRLTHSLEVAQIARTVSRYLGLDEDLAEAISLAHDLGHTPFGHAGETALNEVMSSYGGFDHNEQTVRVLTHLERCYASFDGLNLTWETLEGVVKHNGPVAAGGLRETVRGLDASFDLALGLQGSLEAQISSLADDIAYLSHDVADGIRAGFLSRGELVGLPLVGEILRLIESRYGALETSRFVHELTRRLIKRAVRDLLAETESRLASSGVQSVDDIRKAGDWVAGFSPQMAEELGVLKDFLLASVWRHYQVNRMTSKARRMLGEMFSLFMAEPNTLPHEWQSVEGEPVAGIDGAGRARHIADYIAGMTDRYAALEHKRLFDPGPILR